jgi:REP element-mobilizing transposase RayT
MKTHYRNRLPHIAPIGATFFITFRLVDSLPTSVLFKLKDQWEYLKTTIKQQYPDDYDNQLQIAKKRQFVKYEKALDKNPIGKCILNQPKVAEIVAQKLKQYDDKYYSLIAYCIMPNHVHFLANFERQLLDKNKFQLNHEELNYKQLSKIMQYIKGGSAREINLHLNNTGNSVWAKDSYDHFIRNDKEFKNVINYILKNPVKAGFVESTDDWKYSYVNWDFVP